MIARVALVLLLSTIASVLHAQASPPLWLVAKGDTVLLYLTATPSRGGFVVYRAPPGSGARQKRTAEPVVRVRDPGMVSGILGSDLGMVMRATRATDEGEMFRRLNGDKFAADILSGFSRGVATALGRLYIDGGVTRGAEYEYRVVFTDRAGAETDSVLTARIRVVDVAPASPTALRIAVNDGESRLTWTHPRYRGDPRDLVLGFHVYRADGPAAAFRRLTVTPVVRNDARTPEFQDAEVRNGVTYRYRVMAVDIAGRESPPLVSEPTIVKDRTAPSIPAEVTVQEGEGFVGLGWRLAPEMDVAGYHVERSDGLAERFTRLNAALIPSQRPEWTDTVAGSRRYFYRIIAVDAAGNASEPSNPMTAVAKDKLPPDAPTAVVGTVVARRLTIRWAASRAKDLRGYYVYRAESADRLVRLMEAPVVRTQFVDSGYSMKGLRPGASYTIEVSAVDSSFNESPKTRAEIHVADDEAPSPPTAMQARNVDGRYVEVTWSPSAALDIAAYELTRSAVASASDSTLRLGRFDPRARVTRDTAVVKARRYLYRLVAIDTTGNRSVAATDTAEFRDFVAPPAPRVVRAGPAASGASGGVSVTWQRVISADLVGYHVYRSELPTGVFKRLTTAPVTELAFTDRMSTPRVVNFYYVKAVDRSGNESRQSPVAEVPRP
jgi:fibronectin type 3 domain-containing protein